MGFSGGGMASGAASGAATGSMFGPWGTAIGAIGGGLMGAFGKKKKGGENVPLVPMLTPAQMEAEGALSKFVKENIGNFKPGEEYGGKLTAGRTGLEGTGLEQLSSLLGKPATGEAFGAGKQQILDTLGGKYADPAKSPWIQSMMRLSNQNYEDLIDQSRRSAGARGSYYTDSAIRDEGRIGERSLNNLNAIIGQFQNTERGRQFDAADKAMGFDKYENLTAPLTRIAASQDLGGLDRTIEQGDLERKYQDFTRQRDEMKLPLTAAESLYGKSVPYGLKEFTAPQREENNTMGNIIGMIGELNKSGALKGLKFGGNAGTVGNTGKTQSQILGYNTAKYR